MTQVVHILPWLNLRQGKARPKTRRVGWRTGNHRVIPQETIDALRKEYDALPIANVKRKSGTVKALCKKYGISLAYGGAILYMGLRDHEREDK